MSIHDALENWASLLDVDLPTAKKIRSRAILADVRGRLSKREKAGNRYSAKAAAAKLRGEM